MASNLNYRFWVRKTKILSAVDKLPSTVKEDLRKIFPNVLSRIETKKSPCHQTERSFLADFSVFHIKQVFPAQITADSILDAGTSEKCLQAFNAFHEVFLPLAVQLRQDVIQQQYRTFSRFLSNQLNFRKSGGKSRCPLLSLGAELLHILAIDQKKDVVFVGACVGGAGVNIPV